jgi:hypothetical protein
MNEAITQSRRGYKKIVNLTTSDFYLAYWEYLRRHHPHILMEKPSSKSFKSNWFIMRGAHFPKRVLIHHKMRQRVVELGFSGRTQSELLAIKADWPFGIVPLQKGKRAVLSINVPEMETGKGLAGQELSLEAVFAAVDKLIPYAHLFEATSAAPPGIE